MLLAARIVWRNDVRLYKKLSTCNHVIASHLWYDVSSKAVVLVDPGQFNRDSDDAHRYQFAYFWS